MTDFCTLANMRAGINPFRAVGLMSKEGLNLGIGEVRVGRTNDRFGKSGQGERNDGRRSPGFFQPGKVLEFGQKGNFSLSGLFEAGDSCDRQKGIPGNLSPY